MTAALHGRFGIAGRSSVQDLNGKIIRDRADQEGVEGVVLNIVDDGDMVGVCS